MHDDIFVIFLKVLFKLKRYYGASAEKYAPKFFLSGKGGQDSRRNAARATIQFSPDHSKSKKREKALTADGTDLSLFLFESTIAFGIVVRSIFVA